MHLALFEAAHVILTWVSTWSSLKDWAMNVAKRRGAKRSKVGVVLHRMWVDRTDFRGSRLAQA